MKNFDFPYINDAPLEDNWREGAPRDCEECGAEDIGRNHECDDEDEDHGTIADEDEERADAPETKESWED